MTAGGEDANRRLGFGCAGLMQTPSGKRRQRLLGEAFECGIRHFDVARMYGLGMAEGEVGKFARGRRDRIAIATKFGIEPAASIGRLARLQAPARAVVGRFPALRAALRRREGALHQPRRYDSRTARESLETSLRELGTDYVDLFLIHGAAPGDAIDLDNLGETLEDLRQAGTLRAWGLAGERRSSAELVAAVEPPPVLQIRDDLFEPFAVDPGRPPITFGVLSRALPRIVAHVNRSEARRAAWRRAVGEDCGRPEAVSALLLCDALLRNPTGTVLVSSTRPERVALAAAAEDLSREGESAPLRAFRELAAAIDTVPEMAAGG